MVGFPLAVYVLLYYNCPLRRVQLTILHGNSILSYHAGVVELADSTDLGSVTFMVCGFDSMLSVAEFVENEEQAALLRELGCDVFQGYLYSKSLLPSDCLQFIQKRNGGNGA